MAKPNKAALHVARWLMLASALSCTFNVPLMASWVPDEARQLHEKLISYLRDIVSVSLLFFTVENNDKQNTNKRAYGVVWTHILRWNITNIISLGKKELFTDRPTPFVLQKLGDAAETLRKVQRFLRDWRAFAHVTDKYLELHEDTAFFYPTPRRRRL